LQHAVALLGIEDKANRVMASVDAGRCYDSES